MAYLWHIELTVSVSLKWNDFFHSKREFVMKIEECIGKIDVIK